MSASLVGSEMCIRDSPSTFRRGFRGAPRSFPNGSRGVRWGFRGGSEASVSYTHLTLPTICSV
eukprot:905126-Alexandrium_andersonii.AAC.1